MKDTFFIPMQWRHNGCLVVSNHQHIDCLVSRLSRRISKKITKLRFTSLCEGNQSNCDRSIPPQRASNAEIVPIWWCHHEAWNVKSQVDLRVHTCFQKQPPYLTECDNSYYFFWYRRFDPGLIRLREKVKAGAVGTILSIHTIARDHPLPPTEYLKVSGQHCQLWHPGAPFANMG